MKSFTLFAAAALFGTMATAEQAVVGCYKSTAGLTFKSTEDYNSVGRCGNIVCKDVAAFAMVDKKCYCGESIPSDSDKVDVENCNYKCPGYPSDNCMYNEMTCNISLLIRS